MQPESLSNNSTTGILEIRWQDGSMQQLSNAFLRANCRCADCKSLSNERLAMAETDTRITEIIPVGSYGVQLIFSDGHQRGIFPWTYLKHLSNTAAISPSLLSVLSFFENKD